VGVDTFPSPKKEVGNLEKKAEKEESPQGYQEGGGRLGGLKWGGGQSI